MSFGDQQSPYQAPNSMSSDGGKPIGDTTKKPGMLIAVSVISIILGGIYCCFGCCLSTASFMSGQSNEMAMDFMESAFEGMEEDMKNAQLESTKKAMEVAGGYAMITGVIEVVGLLGSILMVVGGIVGLTKSPLGKSLMLAAFVFCILVSVVRLGLGQYVANQQVTAQSEVLADAGFQTEADSVASVGTFTMIGTIVFYLFLNIFHGVMAFLLATSRSISTYYAALKNSSGVMS